MIGGNKSSAEEEEGRQGEARGMKGREEGIEAEMEVTLCLRNLA